MIYHLILLAGTAALATSIEMSAYNVIARPRNLQSWEDVLQDERNISFDGSVADIQALALEKAQALANNNNNNNNKGPPEDLAKPVTCDGTLTQSVLSLRFQYSVEYDPNYDASQQQSTPVNSEKSSNLEEIIETIEQEVQNRLSWALLTCKVDDVEVQAARVVGLVRTPRDEALIDEPCVPDNPDSTCANYLGRMTLFLAEQEKEELASYLALLNVKNILEDESMITMVDRGLVKVTYLGPELIAPYEPESKVEKSSSMSGTSIAVLSAGAGTIMIFLLIMVAWRRTFNKGDVDLMLYDRSTTAGPVNGSILIPPHSGDEEEEDLPASPFSLVVPSAYRYSENMSILSGNGLSAVSEKTETDSSKQSVGSIEDGAENNVLGIRKREIETNPRVGEDNMLDFSQAVGESFSDVSESPSDDGGQMSCVDTTQLLLGISSPTRMNTSQEDDAFLFLP